jgi:hypothetical protein
LIVVLTNPPTYLRAVRQSATVHLPSGMGPE